MALRSVVAAPSSPPPGPRRTVVLRAGGPKPRGGLIDVVACILGVLLLIGAVVLVRTLPEEDYVNPRYKLSFPGGVKELEGGSDYFDFVEGSAVTHDFPIEVLHDNVYQITINVGFRDDVEASEPDSVRFMLFDPQGNQVGDNGGYVVTNDRPVASNQSTEPGTFVGSQKTVSTRIAFGIVPQEQILEAVDRDETYGQALLRVEPQYHVVTKGTWIVRMELFTAGDCPDPAQGGDPQQAFACFNQQPAESASLQDTGNRVYLENFVWSYYGVCTELLEIRDPQPLPACRNL